MHTPESDIGPAKARAEGPLSSWVWRMVSFEKRPEWSIR